MKFSVIYKPVNLFSLKDSGFTNSGAKSLLLPSPYAIKMALFNQAITIEGKEIFQDKKSKEFSYIKNAQIDYFISGSFCVNNCFVTIQSLRDGAYRSKPSFREYIYLSGNLEIIFEVENESAKKYLQNYLHKINYFGKRGCFFQFIQYNDGDRGSNVKEFSLEELNPGMIQEFDDISPKAEFKHIDNFDSATAKRDKRIMLIPVKNIASSKSFTHYRLIH